MEKKVLYFKLKLTKSLVLKDVCIDTELFMFSNIIYTFWFFACTVCLHNKINILDIIT